MAVDRSKYQDSSMQTDRNWPEKGTQLTVGDSVEGTYVALKTNVGANASNVYVLELEDGDKVGVWGSTVIDARFKDITIGTEVALEYLGPKSPKSGGKAYKDFWVGVVPGTGQSVASADRDIHDDDMPF